VIVPTENFIDEFTAEWIAALNSHDIERILNHMPVFDSNSKSR